MPSAASPICQMLWLESLWSHASLNLASSRLERRHRIAKQPCLGPGAVNQINNFEGSCPVNAPNPLLFQSLFLSFSLNPQDRGVLQKTIVRPVLAQLMVRL